MRLLNRRRTPTGLPALIVGITLAAAGIDAFPLPAAVPPDDQDGAARRDPGGPGVRTIRLGTVLDQMLFDKDRIVVQAGKPVEVVFENNDLMPHNFVVTQPGALEEVGVLAEETATQPGALERHFVPRTRKVLFATRLLQPRDSQRLDFNAPGKAGVYPYVCTYPGHWRRMNGSLYVVDDLDDYLADAELYLSRHPLPVADELLKSNRQRKEWTLDDLAAAAGRLKEGRSYSNAKQMFQVATCVACHKLNGVGEEFGPDLAKLDPRMTAVDVLKNVLDPSLKIDDKYRTYLFEMTSGKVVTGMILEETADTVTVIENPIAAPAPVVLRTSEVADRARSPTSIMPKGLLDKLTREEILDLLSYVLARGDARNPLFLLGTGAHQHGTGH